MLKAVGYITFLALSTALAEELPPVKTVFVIVMENHDWSDIKTNSKAPFINEVLLPRASYCERYYTPPGLRPSEPNYLWLEAGTNFGIFDDGDPAVNHQSTTNHLATQLFNAGISWRTYQEDISGMDVPLISTNGYAPKHNPFVYFDDVTGTNSPTYAYGIEHIRPFTELKADLAANTVARYNFITPNLCHDMHDFCLPQNDQVQQGDDWLASIVPQIFDSLAYRDNGALFITWDEGGEDYEGRPIGLILLSPLAKGWGYACTNVYTHSSLLRTLQEIFGVAPLLGDAAKAENLADLFLTIKLTCNEDPGGWGMVLTAFGVQPGRTNVFEASADLVNWVPISTNCATSNQLAIIDDSYANVATRFYRVFQAP